jgi:hypothetical protein
VVNNGLKAYLVRERGVAGSPVWERAAPEAAAGVRYEVLHLSTPALDAIEPGRQW